MANETIEYLREDPPWSGVPEGDPFVNDLRRFGAGYPWPVPPEAGIGAFGLPLERGIKIIGGPLTHLSPQYGLPYRLAYELGGWWEAERRGASCPYSGAWSDEYDESSVATAADLAEVLQEINNLAFLEESDEFGLLRPSYHALRICIKTILDLVVDDELQRPSDISTDRNGDIRIAWAVDGREAELVFPSDERERPYLYYSSPSSYGIEADLSSPTISRRINWALQSR